MIRQCPNLTLADRKRWIYFSHFPSSSRVFLALQVIGNGHFEAPLLHQGLVIWDWKPRETILSPFKKGLINWEEIEQHEEKKRKQYPWELESCWGLGLTHTGQLICQHFKKEAGPPLLPS